MSATPKPWTMLSSDDGVQSIIVPEGATVAEGLCEMVQQMFGTECTPEHPAIVQAARGQSVDRWHSCSAAWRRDRGLDTDTPYWSDDGDGRRSVLVVVEDMSLTVLNDQIEEMGDAD